MTVSLTGCNSGTPELTSTAGTTIVAVNTAPSCDGSGSRTAIDPTEYTSEQIGVNWLPNDKIGVYGDKGSGNVGFDNQSSSETDRTTFGGKLKDGEKPLYAYYPYNPTAGDDPAKLSGTLPLTQHYSTTTRELEGDWKVGLPYESSTNEFRFSHIFAFFKFDINAGGTEVAGEKLQSVSLKIDGTQLGGDFYYDLVGNACSFSPTANSDCVTMEWSDTPDLTATTFHGYMSVAPCTGISGKNIDIVITTNVHIIRFSQTCKVDGFEANTYYTVPLELAKFKDSWTIEDNPDQPNADWVPGLESRLACANTVFAVPGKPFMHKIRVPQNSSQTAHAVVPVKTGVKRAYNLPEGLTWNADRCLVEGTAPAAGEYTYTVEFEIDGVTYREGIRLTVSDDLVSPTPMMGWQSWNVLKDKISETIIKNQTDKLVSLGLRDAGYIYIGIDDCWQQQSGRDSQTKRQIPMESKFPNGMKAVTDYIHGLGLKAGIYSDAGTVTCEGYEASYNYESTDAQAYADWGFDMLKEDWFWSGHGDNNGALDHSSTSLAHELYSRMGKAFAATGRKMQLYMCEWGTHDPWKWAPEAGASCWRMSYDARDGWWGAIGSSKNNDTNDNGIGLHNSIVLMRNLWPYVGINRYNDADMLCVGIRGKGQSSSDCVYGTQKYTGMTDTEYETNFAMWCMWSSPLLLSIDMTSTDLNTHDLNLMKNEELIAINQDPMGQGAEYIKSDGEFDYYSKDLANGDVAIAVVNLGDKSGNYNIVLGDYEALDANSTYSVRNLLSKSDAGTLSASSPLSGSIEAHGTFIIRLKKN